MRKTILSSIALYTLFIMAACGSRKQSSSGNQIVATLKDTLDKGIGKFTEMQLTHPLKEEMVSKGELIYKSKCFACHKLTTEKFVGPGWKGITDRRAPEWIMNFITNTDVMLDSNLVAQQLMVVCVSRMPNQNLSTEEARNVLEFIRKNDGKN